MRFISDNLVELNQSEADAIHSTTRAGSRNGCNAMSSSNELAGFEEVAVSRGEIDLTAGIKLAKILHRGKIHAAVLAGVVSETISAIVQEGERIINDGDIERGRALAQRNFEADPEAAIEKALGENDLNFVVATLAKARANGEGGMFVGIDASTAEDMSDQALADWVRAMRTSLVNIGNEQVRRGLTPDDLSVQAAFANGEDHYTKIASKIVSATAAAGKVASQLAAGALSAVHAKPKRKAAARKRTTAKAGASGRGAKGVLRSRK